MTRREISGSQRMSVHAAARTPPRVAPRLPTQVKNMRLRNKKNTLSGKK
jgi:hypothetical protein